ncbi:MAG: HNH endonuclease signature motif containing protein [Thermoguttaceae bacterium]
MPTAPARLCRKPGCPGFVRDGRCTVCGGGHRQDFRPSAAARGYDHRWSDFAASYKRRHPLCAVCEAEGRTTLADLPHHIIPIQEGGEIYPDDDGLLPVCYSCHQRVEGLGREWRKVVKIKAPNAQDAI